MCLGLVVQDVLFHLMECCLTWCNILRLWQWGCPFWWWLQALTSSVIQVSFQVHHQVGDSKRVEPYNKLPWHELPWQWPWPWPWPWQWPWPWPGPGPVLLYTFVLKLLFSGRERVMQKTHWSGHGHGHGHRIFILANGKWVTRISDTFFTKHEQDWKQLSDSKLHHING